MANFNVTVDGTQYSDTDIRIMRERTLELEAYKDQSDKVIRLEMKIAELEVKLEVETKAAGHWMEEANQEHNKNVKLEEQLNQPVIKTEWQEAQERIAELEEEVKRLCEILHTERQAIAKRLDRIKKAASRLDTAVYDAAMEGE